MGTLRKRECIKKRKFKRLRDVQHAHRTTEGGLADNKVLAEIAGDLFWGLPRAFLGAYLGGESSPELVSGHSESILSAPRSSRKLPEAARSSKI